MTGMTAEGWSTTGLTAAGSTDYGLVAAGSAVYCLLVPGSTVAPLSTAGQCRRSEAFGADMARRRCQFASLSAAVGSPLVTIVKRCKLH